MSVCFHAQLSCESFVESLFTLPVKWTKQMLTSETGIPSWIFVVQPIFCIAYTVAVGVAGLLVFRGRGIFAHENQKLHYKPKYVERYRIQERTELFVACVVFSVWVLSCAVLWTITIIDDLLLYPIGSDMGRTSQEIQAVDLLYAWKPSKLAPFVAITGYSCGLAFLFTMLSPSVGETASISPFIPGSVHVAGGVNSRWKRLVVSCLAVTCAIWYGLDRPWYPNLISAASVVYVDTPVGLPGLSGSDGVLAAVGAITGIPVVTTVLLTNSSDASTPTPSFGFPAEDSSTPFVELRVGSEINGPIWSLVVWSIGCALVSVDAVLRLACCYASCFPSRTPPKPPTLDVSDSCRCTPGLRESKRAVDTQWCLLVLLLFYNGLERLAHQPHTHGGYLAWLLCTDILAFSFFVSCLYVWYVRKRG